MYNFTNYLFDLGYDRELREMEERKKRKERAKKLRLVAPGVSNVPFYIFKGKTK